MIFLEILKPEPPSIIDNAVQKVRNMFPRTEDSNRILGWSPGEYTWTQGKKFLLKHVFTNWLENEVRPKFAVGTLATMKGIAYIPNKVPECVLKVIDLVEITWHAEIDAYHHQPRCVITESVRIHSGNVAFCPNQLRPLTSEEADLVSLRDKAHKELDAKLHSIIEALDNKSVES